MLYLQDGRLLKTYKVNIDVSEQHLGEYQTNNISIQESEHLEPLLAVYFYKWYTFNQLEDLK